MAIPRKDSLLVPYSMNMNERINATPAIYGLTPDQGSKYLALHEVYVAAVEVLDLTRANGDQSQSLTAARNTARKNLLDYARMIYASVQKNTEISDADKILLGVHIIGRPTAVKPPAVAPATTIKKVAGQTVTVSIFDPTSSTKRRKVKDAIGAWVYSFVGENYPADPALWQFEGTAGKHTFDVTIPNAPPGARVWLCARWVTRKGETGPMSMPISTYLQCGGVTVQADLKLAA